jgi:hypothetical protein
MRGVVTDRDLRAGGGSGRVRSWRFLAGLCAISLVGLFSLPAAAQISVDVPKVSEVPPEQPSAIDGTYTTDYNGAEFRIDRGRVIVVTPYSIMFVVKMERDSVVTRDIARTAPGVFVGYDLGLKGKWEGRLNPDGTIHIKIAGQLFPLEQTFTPIQLADPAWQKREIAEMQGKATPPVQYDSRPGSGSSGSIYPPGWDAR